MPDWLNCEPVLGLVGGKRGERQRAYRQYVERAVLEGLGASPWEQVRHLSIKLCLTGGSSGLLKTRLKQSIELRKSRGNAAGQGSPTAIFQRGDGESKFELQGLFRVKVTTTVAAHNLQLAIDGFNEGRNGVREEWEEWEEWGHISLFCFLLTLMASRVIPDHRSDPRNEMARPLRIYVPGAWYHVTARGNERRDIVRDDTDREGFLTRLAAITASGSICTPTS